jgi:glycerophosphoryl diester phosphodiesterase family protein
VAPAPEPRRRRTPVAEIFEETFRLYRQHFLLMVGIFAVFQVPFLLAIVPFEIWQIQWSFGPFDPNAPFGTPSASMPSMEQALLVLGAGLLLALASLILGTFGGAAISYIAGRAKNGDRPSAREVFLALRRLAAPILGYVAILVIGGLLLIVALIIVLTLVIALAVVGLGRSGAGAVVLFLSVCGVIAIALFLVAVGVRISLAIPALVLERQRPMEALRRSWDLVRGSTWRTFGILVLAGFVVGLIGGLVSPIFLPGILQGVLAGSPAAILFVTIVSGAAQILLGPILPALVTVLYFDYARQPAQPTATPTF